MQRIRENRSAPLTQVDHHRIHGEVLLDEQVGVGPEGVQDGQDALLVV